MVVADNAGIAVCKKRWRGGVGYYYTRRLVMSAVGLDKCSVNGAWLKENFNIYLGWVNEWLELWFFE